MPLSVKTCYVDTINKGIIFVYVTYKHCNNATYILVILPMSCCCCLASETAKQKRTANAKCKVIGITENKKLFKHKLQINTYS